MIELTAEDFMKILNKEGINPDDLPALAVEELKEFRLKAATAESCTGGLISKRITDVSGASEVFDCGVCTYANRIKNKVLGVKNETLDTVGAVSPETAAQMAQGVRELADADFGVSTTGIAGPTGGTETKPVGLVYIAVSDKNTTEVVKTLLGGAGDGGREAIRKTASDAAFYFLLKKLVKITKRY